MLWQCKIWRVVEYASSRGHMIWKVTHQTVCNFRIWGMHCWMQAELLEMFRRALTPVCCVMSTPWYDILKFGFSMLALVLKTYAYVCSRAVSSHASTQYTKSMVRALARNVTNVWTCSSTPWSEHSPEMHHTAIHSTWTSVLNLLQQQMTLLVMNISAWGTPGGGIRSCNTAVCHEVLSMSLNKYRGRAVEHYISTSLYKYNIIFILCFFLRCLIWVYHYMIRRVYEDMILVDWSIILSKDRHQYIIKSFGTVGIRVCTRIIQSALRLEGEREGMGVAPLACDSTLRRRRLEPDSDGRTRVCGRSLGKVTGLRRPRLEQDSVSDEKGRSKRKLKVYFLWQLRTFSWFDVAKAVAYVVAQNGLGQRFVR